EIDSRTVGEAEGWSWKFEHLPKYKNGVAIQYTLVEDAVPGYTADYDGYNVKNTHVPEEIEISGTKTWNDNGNQDGVRPERITVRLSADGTEIDSRTVGEAEGWSWKFEHLPKYKNGVAIQYTLVEDAVPGYTADYDGYNVKNTHVPEKTSVAVTKSWNDQNDKDGIRPKSITVHLLADGKDTGKKLVLSAENKWMGSFTDLDVNKDGKRIVYTVSEDDVTGYTKSITGDADKGFTVTNSHTPNEPPPKAPKTGDDMNRIGYYGAMAVSAMLLMVFRFFWQRKNREKA
ncbi:MAG: Cna B-type domain-containing protein, partial [Ndongobacter sp.]|nr:Cna B-type domain-containing protein [Ndongobacter sp.]